MFRDRSIFRHRLFKPLVSSAILASMVASAAPPAWWSDGDPPVIDPNAVANNHGVANIGQAKWMAKQALEALGTKRPGLASKVASALVGEGRPIASWNAPVTAEDQAKQRQPLLLGQLKAMAAPFYDRLHAAEPVWLAAQKSENGLSANDGHYPWTNAVEDDANTAMATIGQLKAVFSLRFETLPVNEDDVDGDDLADDWEIQYFGNLTFQNANGDPDADGLTNAEEAREGTHPDNGDTDNDGIGDGVEKSMGRYPAVNESQVDGDGDNACDQWEIIHGTDPANASSGSIPAGEIRVTTVYRRNIAGTYGLPLLGSQPKYVFRSDSAGYDGYMEFEPLTSISALSEIYPLAASSWPFEPGDETGWKITQGDIALSAISMVILTGSPPEEGQSQQAIEDHQSSSIAEVRLIASMPAKVPIRFNFVKVKSKVQVSTNVNDGQTTSTESVQDLTPLTLEIPPNAVLSSSVTGTTEGLSLMLAQPSTPYTDAVEEHKITLQKVEVIEVAPNSLLKNRGSGRPVPGSACDRFTRPSAVGSRIGQEQAHHQLFQAPGQRDK